MAKFKNRFDLIDNELQELKIWRNNNIILNRVDAQIVNDDYLLTTEIKNKDKEESLIRKETKRDIVSIERSRGIENNQTAKSDSGKRKIESIMTSIIKE